MEEKLALIGQAKEAEERRNQDMRRFADDRERHARQQAEMVKSSVCFQRQYQTSILVKERIILLIHVNQESLAACLAARDEEMESWRKERDTLVSALEVQLKKLIVSNAEKDQQIKILQSSNTPQTPEVSVSYRSHHLHKLFKKMWVSKNFLFFF